MQKWDWSLDRPKNVVKSYLKLKFFITLWYTYNKIFIYNKLAVWIKAYANPLNFIDIEYSVIKHNARTVFYGEKIKNSARAKQ